jgi:hypothetical protein
MAARRIQVSRENFETAATGDSVFGLFRKQILVKVALGREVEYRPHPNDDPNTEYRCFLGSAVAYYRNAEEAFADLPSARDRFITVILYC